MEGHDFEQARYAGMRWNTPLSEEHAARLPKRLEISHRHSVLDLGCGREEWRLAHAGDPRAAAVAAELAERLTEYVDVYRGVLGFTYLVLTR